MTPCDVPPEILQAAKLLLDWAQKVGLDDLPKLTERQYAERYAVCRVLGTQVQVERWAGPRLVTVYGQDYDRIVENHLRSKQPTVGTTLALAKLVKGG